MKHDQNQLTVANQVLAPLSLPTYTLRMSGPRMNNDTFRAWIETLHDAAIETARRCQEYLNA